MLIRRGLPIVPIRRGSWAAKLSICIALAACTTQGAYAQLKLDLAYVDKSSEKFGRFRDWVDSHLSGKADEYFSAGDAVVMKHLTGQKRYCDLAVGIVDGDVTAAEASIAAGTKPSVADDSYLHAGAVISDLSLAYSECESSLSVVQRTRWAKYADRTIENIWNPRGARWADRAFPWSGWSIDDPANNYYYSFVEATMYWALASHNEKWLTFLRAQKLAALQSHFAALPGGGSLEGTGYGTSHMRLFSIYQTWLDATGTDLANANSHLTDSIAYWVHATVPTLDRFAPIGDQARVSIPEIYDYQRRLMLEASHLTKDPKARNLAWWWLSHISVAQMQSGQNFRYDLLPAKRVEAPPADLIYQAKGLGQVFARTDWTRHAMWLAFIAGPYSESHAHQEQGAFTLFEGDWLAVTENIWTHSGIQQGTETNNVIRFVRNGATIPQRSPSLSTMTLADSGAAHAELHASADLSPAYKASAGVRMWKREIDFSDRKLRVHDRFSVANGTRAIFQINVPTRPKLEAQRAQAGKLCINVVTPTDAKLSAFDWSTQDAEEFHSGWRIDIEGSGEEFVVEMTTSKCQ